MTASRSEPSGAADHVDDALERPAEILARYTQRRREADRRLVRVLGQDPARHQPLADVAGGPDRGVQIDADPQTSAAHLGDLRQAGVTQRLEQPRAELRGRALIRALAKHLDDLDADRARERVPAERR